MIKTCSSLGQDRSSRNHTGNNALESHAAWNCIFNSVSRGATSCLIHWFLHQVDLTRHVLPSEETQPCQTQAVGSREEVGPPAAAGLGSAWAPSPASGTLPPGEAPQHKCVQAEGCFSRCLLLFSSFENLVPKETNSFQISFLPFLIMDNSV